MAILDFKKLTKKEARDYLKNIATKEQKADIKKKCYVPIYKSIFVNAVDEKGNPITYITKNGETKIKKQRIPTDEVLKYEMDLLKLKWWMADNVPEVFGDTLPKRHKEEEKEPPIDWDDFFGNDE